MSRRHSKENLGEESWPFEFYLDSYQLLIDDSSKIRTGKS